MKTMMMKKTLATIAAMAMAFALCSCGNTADSEPTAAQPDSSVAASAALDDDSEASQADSSGSSDSSDSSSAEVTTTPKADDPSEESTEKADGGKTTTAAKNSSGKTTTAAKNNSGGKTTTAKNSGKTTTAKKATTPAAPSPAPETTTPAPAPTTTTTTTTPAPTPAPPATEPQQRVYMEDYEYAMEVFRLINVERVNAGLQPLEFSQTLYEGATIRAWEECDWRVNFDHKRPDGRDWDYVYIDIGLCPLGSECIEGTAILHEDPQHCVDTWMNSTKGHREGLLNKNAKIGAVGYVRTADGYGTLVFHYASDIIEL